MNIHLTSYGQGHPIVFFHGWGFDQYVWTPLIERLHASYRLILVDLPGFGSTSLMNWDTFKEMLLHQLPALFSVVGWSLGGLYAQRLALEVSSRVHSIMSIASSPRFTRDKDWPAVSKEVFAQFYHKLSSNVSGTLNDFVALNKGVLYLGTVPSLAGLEAGLKILEEWDFRDRLNHLTVPACFLFGRLDPITPAQIMDVMQRDYPQFDYVLFKRSAHMPFLSHEDLFINELKRFIP